MHALASRASSLLGFAGLERYFEKLVGTLAMYDAVPERVNNSAKASEYGVVVDPPERLGLLAFEYASRIHTARAKRRYQRSGGAHDQYEQGAPANVSGSMAFTP